MTVALIIGRANCVWDDILYLEVRYPDLEPDVIAVNGVGCDLKMHINHWVSFHAELFPQWISKRRVKGFSDAGQLWTSSRGRRMDKWERELGIRYVDNNGGSSGMVAVDVALKMGYQKMILVGIPLEAEKGHYDQPGSWDEATHHRKPWEELDPAISVRIKSVSGWTRELLGAPTKEWVDGWRL
jgi:hypothetical protein